GEQRPAQQFIVESGAENPSLRLIETRTIFLVRFDLRGQLLDLGWSIMASGDRLKLRVDHIGLGQESCPEICLGLVVLELRDRSTVGVYAVRTVEIGRHFAKPAHRAGVTGAAGSRVQICVILNNV